MLRVLLFSILSTISLWSFETTNVQLLYSNGFDGNTFVYDTKNGKKTTVTFEHFRTFDYGDVYVCGYYEWGEIKRY